MGEEFLSRRAVSDMTLEKRFRSDDSMYLIFASAGTLHISRGDSQDERSIFVRRLGFGFSSGVCVFVSDSSLATQLTGRDVLEINSA